MTGLEHYPLGLNAFQVVPPRGEANTATPPKKRGPQPNKSQQSAMALDTPEQRLVRLSQRRALDSKGRAVVDMAPRHKNAITIGSRQDSDKTASISKTKI